jgi:hypothetical protein
MMAYAWIMHTALPAVRVICELYPMKTLTETLISLTPEPTVVVFKLQKAEWRLFFHRLLRPRKGHFLIHYIRLPLPFRDLPLVMSNLLFISRIGVTFVAIHDLADKIRSRSLLMMGCDRVVVQNRPVFLVLWELLFYFLLTILLGSRPPWKTDYDNISLPSTKSLKRCQEIHSPTARGPWTETWRRSRPKTPQTVHCCSGFIPSEANWHWQPDHLLGTDFNE